jgi:hypothetical protein
MIVTRQCFGSCIHTALRNVVIQFWLSLSALTTSVWYCVSLEVNIPSKDFYKDKWTKFIIPTYNCHNYLGTEDMPSYAKQSFGGHALKKCHKIFSDIEWFSECTWESDKRWCSFRHNATSTRPTTYTERELFTYGRRIPVVTKPVYVPSDRARIITKLYEELINISTDPALKDTRTYTNVPLIKLWAGLKIFHTFRV